MTPRADLVRRKLQAIEQAAARLSAWRPITRERLETDLLLQWAVERGLQVAAEALFDAGAHVLSASFQEAVDRYSDIPPRLAAHGVLSADTANRLRGLAGFRNVLVHDYADVDLVSCPRNPSAFGRRCIPARRVARRSNTASILPPRSLRAGRIDALGAQRISRTGH